MLFDLSLTTCNVTYLWNTPDGYKSGQIGHLGSRRMIATFFALGLSFPDIYMHTQELYVE